MPSAYLEYAIDGDNDGHADLWSSVPDALSSAANFLKNLGWVRNTSWGEEVKLPANFAYQESGIENKLSLLEWSKRQITYPDGLTLSSPLQSTPFKAEEIKAAVVLPSGYTGPAFLIYDNFDVILRWNRSIFYALAVGHLADRINGAPALAISPRLDEPRLTREKIQTLQYTLNTMGFVVGTTDGVVGPATRKAIRDFQQKNSMVADGYPSVAVFNALGIRDI
jgi:membrane-bound lytic murein transglycosylase B